MKTQAENNPRSFSKEEKERVKNMNTLDYLTNVYGFSFKKKGRYYRCEQHDSLVIHEDQKGWYWNSRAMGGSDLIEFIRKYEIKLYPEALETLLGASAYAAAPAPVLLSTPASKHLILPEKHAGQYTRLFAYLCKSRMIDKHIVSEMVAGKKMFQDKKGNIVFVGYNENGEAVSANIRGTLTEKRFRGECCGSDKRYTCSLCPLENSPSLYIFESTIEAMSHASMENLVYKNKNSYKRRNRLSLNGVSDVALEHYLKAHPEVKVLNFCLNNDNKRKPDGTLPPNKGQIAAQKLIAKYQKLGYVCNNHVPKNNLNDYNDALVEMVKKNTNTPFYAYDGFSAQNKLPVRK